MTALVTLDQFTHHLPEFKNSPAFMSMASCMIQVLSLKMRVKPRNSNPGIIPRTEYMQFSCQINMGKYLGI
jgi:hypothetical protein